MFRRTLFIGLGGAGGKTLRQLKRELAHQMLAQGWTEGVPQAWAFLHIDSAPTEDGLADGLPRLAPEEYVGLRLEHLVGVPLSQVVERVHRSGEMAHEVSSWAGDIAKMDVHLPLGSGQMRAVGRIVGLASVELLAGRLSSALDRLNRATVVPELREFSRHVARRAGHPDDLSDESVLPPIRVIIVSSLSGGTGSGIFLDVIEMLQSLNSDIETVAFHYTCDVFNESFGDGLAPNTLAATSELINMMMWGVPRPLKTRRDGRGVPSRRAASRNLRLIGRDSRGISQTLHYLVGPGDPREVPLGPGDHIFASTAGLLASLATNPELDDRFTYERANSARAAHAGVTPALEFGMGHGDGFAASAVFGALGFARVTLGTLELRRYAAERLARNAAHRLLRVGVKLESRAERPVEALRAALSFQGADSAADPSERSARPTRAEDLLETATTALTPHEEEGWVREQIDRIMIDIESGSETDAARWTQRIVERVTESQRLLEGLVADHVARTVQRWVTKVNRQVPSTVEGLIAEFGIEHGVRVVEDVLSEIDGLGDQLDRLVEEAAELRSIATQEMLEEVVAKELMDTLSPGAIPVDSVFVRRAAQEAMRHARCSALALVTERPALVLRSLAHGLLHPLADDLKMGLGQVVIDREGWSEWSHESLPSHLRPAPYEFAVIDPAEFDGIFGSLLLATCGGAEDGGLSRACNEMLVGPAASTPEDATVSDAGPRLLSFHRSWAPGPEITGSPDGEQADAEFWLHCSTAGLLVMADRWLMRPNLPFSDLLTSDLRSYTAGPSDGPGAEAERKSRQKRVLDQIDAASRAAEPSVRLSPAVLNGAYAGSPIELAPIEMLGCTLPFADHPLAPAAERWLRTRLVAELVDPELSLGKLVASPTTTIDFLSTLRHPVHPLAIESLMRPISERWSAVTDHDGSMQRFWRFRRARPLDEFVPTSQVQLRCMLRGWFTAELLGLIHIRDGRIAIDADPLGASRLVPFPGRLLSSPFLTERWSGVDVLASVLESMPLAMVLATLNSGSLGMFAAYQALAELGGSSTRGQDWPLEYTSLNPVLMHWVETGARGWELPDWGWSVVAQQEGSVEPTDSSTRCAAVVDALDQTMRFLRDFAEWVTPRPMTPLWFDIYDDLMAALEDVRSAADQRPPGDRRLMI